MDAVTPESVGTVGGPVRAVSRFFVAHAQKKGNRWESCSDDAGMRVRCMCVRRMDALVTVALLGCFPHLQHARTTLGSSVPHALFQRGPLVPFALHHLLRTYVAHVPQVSLHRGVLTQPAVREGLISRHDAAIRLRALQYCGKRPRCNCACQW